MLTALRAAWARAVAPSPGLGLRPAAAQALVLLPLVLLLLWPVAWTGNEENYFLLGLRRVAPGGYGDYDALFTVSDARLAWEYLAGWLVQWLGFDGALRVARLAMAVLYAAAFGILFSSLRLSLLAGLGVIALFHVPGEQLMGREWLFQGVESKTLAYAGVISALGLAWAGRWWWVLGAIVLATWMHFLVGGFWALVLAALALARTGDRGLVLRLVGSFLLAVAPLALLVASDQLQSWAPEIAARADAIYADRVSHHVAPFLGDSYAGAWADGIVATALLAVVMLGLARHAPDRALPWLAFWLLVYLLVAVGISWIDRNTFVLSKFYLFRPSSLALVISLCALLAWAAALPKWARLAVNLALVAVVAGFVHEQWVMKGRAADRGDRIEARLAALLPAVEANSAPGEIVLLHRKVDARSDYTLARRLPRPTLVSWKFVPWSPRLLLDWQQRIDFRDRVMARGCDRPLEYPVRLVVVETRKALERIRNCGPLVWQGQGLYLVRVTAAGR